MGGKKKSPNNTGKKSSGDEKTGEDAALWSTVTASIKPLKDRNSALRIKPKAPTGAKAKKSDPPKLGSVSAAAFTSPLTSLGSAGLGWPTPKRPRDLEVGNADGLDRRTADRLRRGKLPIDGRFDLHGHSRDSGERALKAFIRASYERGARCVLIITGKGKGILQAAAPAWLNDADMRPMIVSIQHAQQRDGGTGALYVLLKRRR